MKSLHRAILLVVFLLLLLPITVFSAQPTSRGVPLPPGAVARLGSLDFLHAEAVSCLALTPDGQTIVAGCSSGEIRLWSLTPDKEHRQLLGHKEEVRALAVTPDGKRVISASLDRSVRFWELATGKALQTVTVHDDGIEAMALSPDGAWLATGSRDETLRVWRVAGGEPIRTIKENARGIATLLFARDNRTLLAGCWDNSIRLWDIQQGKLLQQWKGHDDYVEALAFAPEGKTLASGSKDGTIRLWDYATGKTRSTLITGQQRIWALCFSTDGATLFAGGDGEVSGRSARKASLVFWDCKTGKARHHLGVHVGYRARDAGQSDFKSPFRAVSSLVLSREGKTLISAGADGRIHLWDAENATDLKPGAGHQGNITALAFSPGSKLLASASADGTARLWDPASGKQLHRLAGHGGGCQALQFAPSGKELFTGAEDGQVRVWDPATGKLIRSWQTPHAAIRALLLTPDGQTLITAGGGNERALRLWQASTGKDKGTLQHSLGEILSLGLSPDGKMLVALHQRDGLLRGELGKDGVALAESDLVLGEIVTATFSPVDPLVLAMAHSSRTVFLWNPWTGKVEREFVEDVPSALALHPSPEGRTLASGDRDGAVRLWEVNTGKVRRIFKGHLRAVKALAFADNGRWLASGSADHSVLVWDRFAMVDGTGAQGTAPDLARAWEALASAEGVKGYNAMCLLVSSEAAAVALLEKHVVPVPKLTVERLNRLLTALDARTFKERERASRELAALGRLVEKPLRELLQKNPPLEVKRRVEDLLQKMSGVGPGENWTRLSRAIEVLERIGTPRALDLLRKIAEGGPAPPTTEARATLKRLQPRAEEGHP